MVIWQRRPMDGRGSELQQVDTGSRFWWRALDAQTPPPVMPVSAAHFSAQPSRQTAQPAMGLTLQVPKSDRRKVSRNRKKKTNGVWLVFAACLVAVSGAAAILAGAMPANAARDAAMNVRQYASRGLISVGFGIDQVSLTGQRYTLDQDIFDALDLANVKSFAELDTIAALKRIERLSWVDTAQITRVFPGALNVDINERVPAAIWSRGDKNYLIDVTGRTLGPLPANSGWVLPHLAGEGANTDAPLLLMAISRHKEIQAQFHHAERIAERRWSVVLNNGSRIELGADREVEGMDIVASASVVRQAILASPYVVDVRTAGRATIRPLALASAATIAPSLTSMVQAP
jgi:cell division protein FtsQ